MRLRFLGVRGSTPVSGVEFAQVGGHTSCLVVSVGDELPSLVLDAGTGLQTLRAEFEDRPFNGSVLLTHLHWDHVQGLPFLPALDHDDAQVVLAQPAQGSPMQVLGRAMSPPHFPITPEGLRGAWTHLALEPGKHQFGAFEVLARDVVHKGGRTFGYRVRCGNSTFAYVPDALDANDEVVLELAADVDVLVRGAPFVSSESDRAAAFGHGTAEAAAQIAARARVRRLVLTHHAPTRTDEAVYDIAARVGTTAATEGMTLML